MKHLCVNKTWLCITKRTKSFRWNTNETVSSTQAESQQGLRKTKVSPQPQRALKNLINVFYFRKRLSHFRKPELCSCEKKANIQTVPISSEANTKSFCLYKKHSQMFNLFLNVGFGAASIFFSHQWTVTSWWRGTE